MRRIDVVIIGAGQAGLAMSHALTSLNVEHLVLERGRVAERWLSERWDSLRLLTPNWQTRLPGFRYTGPEPEGFMGCTELAQLLGGYARSFQAPVLTETEVLRVGRKFNAFVVDTNRGRFLTAAVVIASGECALSRVPDWASALGGHIHQVAPRDYKRPSDLPTGGVLVVGASASGAQLADEIQASGRQVTLAVGRHVPLPRSYRGRDIMAWLDESGILSEPPPAFGAHRHGPSLQLVGRTVGQRIDLQQLSRSGVRLAGRLLGVEADRAFFANDLAESTAAAHERQRRLLDLIDAHVTQQGLDGHVPHGERGGPLAVAATPSLVRMRDEGIHTVVWATGYQPDFRYLDLPILSASGQLQHVGGVTPIPGIYALGLRFLRRRNSNFIDGVGRDALELAERVTEDLSRRIRRAA